VVTHRPGVRSEDSCAASSPLSR